MAVEGSGSLCVVWDKLSFSEKEVRLANQWICVKGEMKEIAVICSIFFVYAPNNRQDRNLSWSELIEARKRNHVLTIFNGNFNEVMARGERNSCTVCQASM